MIKKVKLGDLVEFQRGYDLPKSNAKGGGYPVVTSNGIMVYHNECKSGKSVVIGRSGTIGNPQLIGCDFWPHNTTLYIKDFKNNNIEYIYYLLLNIDIGKMKSGSNIPTLNRNHLHPLVVLAEMDINKQKNIARVLKTIDEKIENNKRVNNELESMAKTIYDYWFLQFDFPDENGKPYKSSGGKMVWNEELKREIPIIFTRKEVSELIEVKDGTHDSPQYISNGKYLITSKHLLNSGINFSEANHITDEDFEIINQRSKVDTGDILFSMIGAIGIVYRIDEEKIDFAIKNVALYKTSTSKKMEHYLYYTLKSELMDTYIKRTMAGSIQRFIPLGSLRSMPIAYNEKVIRMFSENIEDIMKRITLIKNETKELSALRDFLLPLLMNGQVRFK